MIFDEFNLPYHTNSRGKDFGDCIHNVGRIAVIKYLLGEDFKDEYLQRISQLTISPDQGGKEILLRRHVTQWNDPNDVSRDATEPIILANIVSDYKSLNYIIWKNLKNNNYSYQNGDIFAPHHLSMWGRFFGHRFIYTIGDLFLLLFVLYRIIIGQRLKNKEGKLSVSDDVNLYLMIRLFKVYKSSRLSRLCDKLMPLWPIEYYFRGRSELGDYMWELFLNENIKNG